MTKQISILVFDDAEEWLRKHLRTMSSDSVSCVRPKGKLNLDGLTLYEDFEEGGVRYCNLDDHIEALQLLCEEIGETLFAGGLISPRQLREVENWDAEVVDVYWQLVMHKKVIYG